VLCELLCMPIAVYCFCCVNPLEVFLNGVVPWLRLLIVTARFDLRLVIVGFMVDKVVL